MCPIPDLEKRQHRFGNGELKPLEPRVIRVTGAGTDDDIVGEVTLAPRTESSILQSQANASLPFPNEKMAGGFPSHASTS